jgi:SAM-dependent methyltransferase
MKSKYHNNYFSPNILGIFYNPFFIIRSELHKSIKNYANLLDGKVIDLGCGTKPYRDLFINANDYIGVDIEQSGNPDSKSKVDKFYDGKNLPFESNSIDGVFSSETFEHIFNLEEIIIELHRVLKRQGLLLVTCPFFWPEHEIPYDFARYTSFGLKDILKRNGFEVVSFEKTGNYILSMLQMTSLYLYYFISKLPILKHIFFVLLITPIFIISIVLNKVLPIKIKRQDLYLNNVILVRKV